MISFLFWNLKKLPRAEIVARLAREHEVDVLLLAECGIAEEEMTADLSEATGRVYLKPWSETAKVEIFTCLPENVIKAVYDDDLGRLTIRRLAIEPLDVLLAAVHFPSKVSWTEEEQRAELQHLVGWFGPFPTPFSTSRPWRLMPWRLDSATSGPMTFRSRTS